MRPLKSVAELEKLRLGNDFILRVAEELSRQSVERAQEAEEQLAAVQLDNARLRERDGGAAGTAGAAGGADTAEAQARIERLEAQLAAKAQDASATVPLDQHERTLEDLAEQRKAHDSAVSAREEAEEALRSEQAEAATLQARLLSEQAAAEKSVADVSGAAEAASNVEAELVAAREDLAKAARAAEGDMQDMQREAAAQQARINSLTADLEAKEQEVNDIMAFHDEAEANTVPLDQHERTLEDLAEQRKAHDSAVSAREEAEEALRSEQAEAATLQARLLSEQAAVEKSVADVAGAVETASNMEAELVAAREDLAKAARAAEGDMQDMQARLTAAQQASDGTDEAAAAMLEESLQLRGELREAAELREASSREFEAAAAAAQRVESEFGDLSAAHALLKTEHSEAKRAHAQSCDEGDELRNELAEAARQQAARSTELEARVAHIVELEAAAKAKDEELATWMEFSNDSVTVDEHEQVTSELREAIEARAAAEAEAAMQRTENELQAQQLEEHRVQVEDTNAARDALQKELEKLREDLAQAQERISRRRRATLEPESEVSSALVLNSAGSGDSVRAFCIENADGYIAASIGRLAQLGATSTEGVFRVSGGPGECEALLEELSETQAEAGREHGEVRYGDLRKAFASCTDVFAIATVTSRWLREKNEQEPWIPSAMRAEVAQLNKDGATFLAQTDASAIGEDAEADAQQAASETDWSEEIGIAKTKQLTHDVCRFVGKLPQRSERVVAPLLCFLRAMDDHASETKMNASNLATVISPSLISDPGIEPQEAAEALAADISFCTLLIRLYEPPPPAPWLVLAAPALSQEPLQLAAAEASWTAQRIELDKENRKLRDQLTMDSGASAMPGTRRSSVASSTHSSAFAEGVPPGSTLTDVAAAKRAAGHLAASKPSGGFTVLLRVATDEDLANADTKKGTSYFHLELWKDGNKITSTHRRYSEFEALRKRCARACVIVTQPQHLDFIRLLDLSFFCSN
eukprot:COSAG02_NODE_32_length_50374_cov_46.674013_7_plen_992_part_00